MFANLKNKLIEEVKASPSKFQQFATAAQAAVSPSVSTPGGSESTATTNATNENFFSITEEDTPQNSPYKPLKIPTDAARGRNSTSQSINNGAGAIPRTRKLSNSSMASDISFRLPTWDTSSVCHLQSDLDESGSEMGDTASTAAKLDVITKEQLFDAYRKSLDRYHKYRSRYTDLAKKYKDLERDSTKARSVLIETQEKAIRRINELREQCSLEQQAKAHLEEALRIEMDDMQCKMQAYQTKLKLLGENPDNISIALAGGNGEQLIDLITETNKPIENSFISINEEINNDVDAKKKFENFEKLLQERDEQILELNNKLDLMRKQEEENVLLLAQTKAAIHSELENKESEVNKLSETIKQLQGELQQINKKDKSVAIEEFNEMKDKLKQIQMSKQELDAKIISSEHTIQELREKLNEKEKAFKSTEVLLQKQNNEMETQLQDLKQQNQQLSEMVTRYQQNEISLAEVDNELNRTKNENDIFKSRLLENEIKLQETESQYNEGLQILHQLQEKLNGKEEMLKQALQRLEELQQQSQQEKLYIEEQRQISIQLEHELKILKEQTANSESETINNLKSELERTKIELNQQLKITKDQLSNKEKELKSLMKKASKNEEQEESHLSQIQKQNDEIKKLNSDLVEQENFIAALKESSQQKEQKINEEKIELKTQINSILNEISQMEEQMRIVQESHQELDNEKRNLENKLENLQHQTQTTVADSKRLQEKLNETEEKLKTCELKLQRVESEHTQMAEKNCLLEENTHRLEKLLAEKERQQAETEDALVGELRIKLQTTENSLQKLNEKMQEVLDENSRLHNNQELNDHDQRTLQDRCDSLEKEKASLEDNKQCLQQELNAAKSKLIEEQQRNKNIQNDILQQKENLLKDLKSKETELREEVLLKEKTMEEYHRLQKEYKAMQSNLSEFDNILKDKQQAFQAAQNELNDVKLELQSQLEEKERQIKEQAESYQLQLSVKENEIMSTKDKLTRVYEEKNMELEKLKEEFILLKEQKELINSKLSDLLENQLESDLLNEELKGIKNQNIYLQEKIKYLEDDKQKNEVQIQDLKEKQQLTMQELERLYRGKELTGMQSLKPDHLNDQQQQHDYMLELLKAVQLQLEELEKKHANKMEEIRKLQEKLSKQNSSASNTNEQLVIENEYLNKHVLQLETELAKQKENGENNQLGSQELKEKLKSLQCELYVFKENSEKYATEVEDREKHIQELRLQNKQLSADLENGKTEFQRQLDHNKYITEHNDIVQKDLILTQNKLKDLEIKHEGVAQEFKALKEQSAQQSEMKLKEINSLKKDLESHNITIETLQSEVKNLNEQLETKQSSEEELQALKNELEERSKVNSTAVKYSDSSSINKSPTSSQDSKHLRKINETLQRELEELTQKSRREISTLQQEVEDLQSTNKEMTDRIMELEILRAGLQAQKLFGLVESPISQHNISNSENASNFSNDFEKQELETKLKTIMAEVQDVSNRNIFLEQKCENYLILEQSNERLKLQNAKLSRQLDETLVSMQHSEGISANTEFEYLKNIMFQYLTGSANGNNETLVKVISAVLKFSPQQTQVALEKEHQRRSLINKIL